MGSMVMSTFAMFMPRRVQFTFILILCLGLSYLESKGRGKVWPPLGWLRRIKGAGVRRKKPVGPSGYRLEQLESLRSAGLIDYKEYQKKRDEILKEL